MDRANDQSLTAHDEQALEAIRRQLDMEFPHYPNTVDAERPVAPRQRRRAATVLGLLLACAGGATAVLLFTTLYQTLKAAPAVDAGSPSAAPAPMARIVATTRPDTTVPPPRAGTGTTAARRHRARPASVPPVPDVIPLTGTVSTDTAPAAFPVAPPAASPPPVAARPPVPLVQLASEHVRWAWETVKEGVVRSPGEIANSPRSGPEAP